ncbi:MAG: DUF3634 family protein [Verrucomicrobiota bacterium]
MIYPTVLSYEAGMVTSTKGKIASSILRDLASILSESGIEKGQLAIDGRGRVVYSKEIPSATYQQIRNVLING